MKRSLVCESEFCRQPFEAVWWQQRFCSASCGSKKYADTCSVAGCGNAHRAKGLCSTHYNSTFLPGSQAIWPSSTEVRKRSLRVKTAIRRARQRGVTAEQVDRVAVGERDGWTCGICSVQIDKDLGYPDPMSQSLDHVLPLSRGGLHTYANTRISHLICNMQRGNRLEAEDGRFRASSQGAEAAA